MLGLIGGGGLFILGVAVALWMVSWYANKTTG